VFSKSYEFFENDALDKQKALLANFAGVSWSNVRMLSNNFFEKPFILQKFLCTCSMQL